MRYLWLVALLVLSACSGSSKKVYDPIPPIKSRVTIEPVWIAEIGSKLLRQHRQLGVLLHEDNIYVSNAAEEGEIEVLEKATGKRLWQKKLRVSISTRPVIFGDRIYFGTNDAQVFALNKNNGDVVWAVQVSSEVLSPPVGVDDKLIVQTIDGKISVLNVNDGSKIWVEASEVPPLTLRGTSAPLVIDGKVIAGFASGQLIAFELQSGKKIWEVAIAVPRGRTDLQRMVDIDGLFEAAGGEVFVVSYQGRIASISLDAGRVIWARDMSSFNGLVLSGNQLYVSDTDDNVWALDKRTGATLWRQDSLTGRDISAPVIMENLVVVADGAGYIHWMSQEDGSFVARHNLQLTYDSVFVDWGSDEERLERNLAVSTPMIVADNRLYIRDNEGALTVYSIVSGNNAEKR